MSEEPVWIPLRAVRVEPEGLHLLDKIFVCCFLINMWFNWNPENPWAFTNHLLTAIEDTVFMSNPNDVSFESYIGKTINLLWARLLNGCYLNAMPVFVSWFPVKMSEIYFAVLFATVLKDSGLQDPCCRHCFMNNIRKFRTNHQDKGHYRLIWCEVQSCGIFENKLRLLRCISLYQFLFHIISVFSFFLIM